VEGGDVKKGGGIYKSLESGSSQAIYRDRRIALTTRPPFCRALLQSFYQGEGSKSEEPTATPPRTEDSLAPPNGVDWPEWGVRERPGIEYDDDDGTTEEAEGLR